MQISVNGKPVEVAAGTTVARLLDELGYAAGRIAVERNQEVVTRARYGETALVDGDRLEVVGFVGGGA